MSTGNPKPEPKIHPATREIAADDPLALHGLEVSGDPNLMLQFLVEEYARIGYGLAGIMRLFRDPDFQAPHGLWRLFGDEELERRVAGILASCGVMRTTTTFTSPSSPSELVQLSPQIKTDETSQK